MWTNCFTTPLPPWQQSPQPGASFFSPFFLAALFRSVIFFGYLMSMALQVISTHLIGLTSRLRFLIISFSEAILLWICSKVIDCHQSLSFCTTQRLQNYLIHLETHLPLNDYKLTRPWYKKSGINHDVSSTMHYRRDDVIMMICRGIFTPAVLLQNFSSPQNILPIPQGNVNLLFRRFLVGSNVLCSKEGLLSGCPTIHTLLVQCFTYCRLVNTDVSQFQWWFQIFGGHLVGFFYIIDEFPLRSWGSFFNGCPLLGRIATVPKWLLHILFV